MEIIINVDDNKVLQAVTAGMIKAGYPKDDVLDDPKLINESDIYTYLIRHLEITADDITIERD